MPPFIYPHRANGRGSRSRRRWYHCRVPLCRETGSSCNAIAPNCPTHKIRMKEG